MALLRHWYLSDVYGTTAVDEAGVANGLYVGQPTRLTKSRGMLPEYGLSHDFDGVDDCVEVATGLSAGGAAFSIVALVRPHSSGAGAARCLFESSSGSGGFYLGITAANLPTFGNASGTLITGAAALTAGQRWLVVGTYDGTNLRLYVGQALAAGPTAASFTGHGDGVIGCNRSGAEWYRGDLQGVALFDAALSLANVQAIYATTVWTEVTPDVIDAVPLVIERGIHDDGPLARLAATGKCTFAMNNSQFNSAGTLGYYSPPNASARQGFDRGTPVRVTLAEGSTGYIQFLGKIRTIDPMPGIWDERRTLVMATDFLDEAARFGLQAIPTQENITADDVIALILQAMQNRPHEIDLEAGSDEYPIALDNTQDERATAQGEFLRLAYSELGFVFARGDGTLVFEARSTRAGSGTVAHTITGADAMTRLKSRRSSEQILNLVKVVVHPRVVASGTQTLFSLEQPLRVDNGLSVVSFGPYRDPAQLAQRVGGLDMIPLAAGTDYVANTAEDGSGTVVTADPTIVVSGEFGANGAYFHITNNYGAPIFLTSLQARGTAVYDYQTVTLLADDPDSIQEDGINEATVDMYYQSSPYIGQDAARFLLNTYTATPTRAREVAFKLNASAALRLAGIAADISTRVQIEEQLTGINGEYFINGIRLEWREAEDIEVAWWLVPADTQDYWIFDTSTFDETTRFGYA
jgi:hypothetical protein